MNAWSSGTRTRPRTRGTTILVRRSLVVGAVFAIAQVSSALAQSGAPPGSIGIRLLEAPADLAEDPRAHVYVIDHLNQGDTIRRRIEVSSGLDRRQRLHLYAAGAIVSEGGFRFLEGRTQNELSSWISVHPQTFELPAHGRASAVVTIAVPDEASDGERYAVVWAQTPPRGEPNEEVAAIDRVGVRVYLSVGRGSAPPVDYGIESMTAERDPSGRALVSASVLNTGGRAIDLNGSLRLTDGPGGLSAGPFPAELGTTIGIGQRASVLIGLSSSIPDGPWKAVLRLRSGQVQRRAQARISFPHAPGGRSRSVPARPMDSAPLVLAVVIALALGGLWLLLVLRRRRAMVDA